LASKTLKITFDILKYSVTLGIAALLLWYVYKDFSFEALKIQLKYINYSWISLSIFIALTSHYLRAYRWNILLEPLGYNLKTSRTFVAVMVGYFANNLVPRLGEVTRCGILKKNDGVSMTSAFGSVVAERVLDLIILMTLASIIFVIEFDKLNKFVIDNFKDKIPNSESIYGLAFAAFVIILVLALASLILFKLFRNKFHRSPMYLKVRRFTKELLNGFLSIKKIKKQVAFWLSTIGIWLLYYMMLIFVFYAFPPTVNLSLIAGFTLLIMSGLGMSAPVQGGIGVFHILVSSVLVLYGISAEDGKVFALIAHTTQFVTIIIFGGISFVISVFMRPKSSYADSK